jgi:CRP/FNR family transcriptional regulator
MYVVLSGEVVVSKKAPEGRNRELATLEGEAVVGDVSMVLASPRTATVTARTEVDALVLDALRFREFLESGELAAYKVSHNLLVVAAERQQRSNAHLIELLPTERETKLGLDAVKLDQVLGEWGC